MATSFVWICLLLIGACNNNPQELNIESKKDFSESEVSTLSLKTISSIPYHIHDSLVIKEQVFEQKTLGLSLSLTIDINDSIIKEMKNKRFDALYINFFCELAPNEIYNTFTDLNFKKRIALDKENFISKPHLHSFTTHLPYRVIAYGSGFQNLIIGYSLLGVKLEKENEENLSTYFIKKIDTNYMLKKTFQTKAHFPDLKTVTIQVKKFELETTQHNVHNYDFSLGGTGLPDLYWSIWCGNSLVYAAPQIKNSTIYSENYTSNALVCTHKDIITIQLADYDNGPFNTQDDIIAEWQGTAKEIPLKTDTVYLKKLKYLIFKGAVKQ